MDSGTLRIKMLGSFSLRWKDREILVSARSRKLYLLLAFLIENRADTVPYSALAELLWAGQSPGAASNALKALLHRARTMLDQLWTGAGRALIVSRDGGCQWSANILLVLDTEEFVRLCQARKKQQPASTLDALSLYQGDYLPALSDHPWVKPRSDEFRQLYLHTILTTLPRLNGLGWHQEAAKLTKTALTFEPDCEALLQAHMTSLLSLGRKQEAARVYEDFQERLLARLGVMPSDQLRELYRQAQKDSDPRAISPVTLLERLLEEPRPGALLCEYDFFRAICQSVSRINERIGGNLYLVLISMMGEEGRSLAQHSLDRAMGSLQEIIRAQLRRGDVFTRCSSSQFVLLLPQASYEDSQMICSRITRAFARKHPHSPALFQTSVQPMPVSRQL